MLDPTTIVKVRTACATTLNDRTLDVDARTAVEGLLESIDKVLSFTSRGKLPVVPPAPRPPRPTPTAALEARVAALESVVAHKPVSPAPRVEAATGNAAATASVGSA